MRVVMSPSIYEHGVMPCRDADARPAGDGWWLHERAKAHMRSDAFAWHRHGRPLWTMAPQHDPLIPPWQRHGLPRRKRQESA